MNVVLQVKRLSLVTQVVFVEFNESPALLNTISGELLPLYVTLHDNCTSFGAIVSSHCVVPTALPGSMSDSQTRKEPKKPMNAATETADNQLITIELYAPSIISIRENLEKL